MSVQSLTTHPSGAASLQPARVDLPAVGGVISDRPIPGGRELAWDPRGGHVRAWMLAVFLGLWTLLLVAAAYWMGEQLLGDELLERLPPMMVFSIGLGVFLLALRALIRQMRHRRPERLILKRHQAVYDPGTHGTSVPLDVMRPERRTLLDPVTLDRAHLETLRLSPDDASARCLLIDVGSEPIPIGKHLRPAERRQLYEHLAAWRDAC